MNAHEPNDQTPAAAGAGETAAQTGSDAAAKPRRRRASPKAEAAPQAQPDEAAEVLQGQDPADASAAPVAPKPARARKPRKPALADAATVGGSEAPTRSAELGDAQHPSQPTPAPAPQAFDSTPTPTPTSVPAMADIDERADVPAGAGDADEGDAGAFAQGEGAGAPREGSRRRRRRNRRERAERETQGERTGAAERAPADARGDDGDGDGDGASGAEAEGEAGDGRLPVPALTPTDPAELFAQVLSGAFDTEAPAEPASADGQAVAAQPPRRVLAPEPDAPKLHKVLAQAGIGSRRDMEQWVLEGRVTVNGEPAHTGQRISFGDRVAVNGKPVKLRIAPPPPRVLAYHKPAGEVVTHDDPQHRPTVFRRLPRLPHGKWQSVGRLDINTEGLLLFTNSGELANQLMHPRFGVEREYAVRSLGVLDDEQRRRLLEGVEIDGQRAAFVSIEDGGGEGVNRWYRVVITEGRNREVRKLFDAVGHAVSRLIRIRYGCVVLPHGLKRGAWVDLPEPDVKALRRLTGTERPRPVAHAGEEGGARDRRGRRGGRGRDGRDRNDRSDRPDRPDRHDRNVRHDGRRESMADAGRERGARMDGDDDGPMHIPNPLQQTYDKRFIQQARRSQREYSEDGPIPNPLQQTYDKRALQRERAPQREYSEDGPIPNPLQQTYDKRFVQKGGAGAAGGMAPGRAAGGPGRPGAAGGGKRGARGKARTPEGRQPDPMQTTMGYLGANALRGKGGKGPKGGKGGRGGGGGGGRGGSSHGPQGGGKRSGRGGNRGA